MASCTCPVQHGSPRRSVSHIYSDCIRISTVDSRNSKRRSRVLEAGVSGFRSQTVGDWHPLHRKSNANHPLPDTTACSCATVHHGRLRVGRGQLTFGRSTPQTRDASADSATLRQFESTCRQKPSDYSGKIIQRFQIAFFEVAHRECG